MAFMYTEHASLVNNLEERNKQRATIAVKSDGAAIYSGSREQYFGETMGFRIAGIPEGGRVQINSTNIATAYSDGDLYFIYEEDVNNTFTIYTYGCAGSTITIDVIPEYPGALVSDGVDDRCFVEGLPTLTDYTVVARRLYSGFEQTGNVNASLASKREAAASEDGAFQFERFSGKNIKTFNFGASLNIKEAIDGSPSVSWQTAGSYNGDALAKGVEADTQSLSLFCLRKGSTANTLKAALYSLILFDRTLTDEEIEWVKTNLIESEQ